MEIRAMSTPSYETGWIAAREGYSAEQALQILRDELGWEGDVAAFMDGHEDRTDATPNRRRSDYRHLDHARDEWIDLRELDTAELYAWAESAKATGDGALLRDCVRLLDLRGVPHDL